MSVKASTLQLCFLVTSAAALLQACSDGTVARLDGTARVGRVQSVSPQTQATVFEQESPSGNLPIAVPKSSRQVRHDGDVLVSETFANSATAPNDWIYTAPSCLTAGSTPPPGSIPACGASAPQDPPGQGALQLTPAVAYTLGLVGWYAPLPTDNGLDIQFTLYDFNATKKEHSDGTLLYFTDGSLDPPIEPDGAGGCLGYFWKRTWCGAATKHGGLANAYLGIGFDEFGHYSKYLNGGPGKVPNTVALGGAVSTGYRYLGGVTNAQGRAASLPFKLYSDSTTRPPSAPTVDVQLSSAGLLEVAFDIHDGHGFVTYLSETVAGINGQPSVPAMVYVGFIGSSGAGFSTHQINDLTISTL
jgi:hypothetical protein